MFNRTSNVAGARCSSRSSKAFPAWQQERPRPRLSSSQLFPVTDAHHGTSATRKICEPPIIAKTPFSTWRGQLTRWLEHQTSKRAVLCQQCENGKSKRCGLTRAGSARSRSDLYRQAQSETREAELALASAKPIACVPRTTSGESPNLLNDMAAPMFRGVTKVTKLKVRRVTRFKTEDSQSWLSGLTGFPACQAAQRRKEGARTSKACAKNGLSPWISHESALGVRGGPRIAFHHSAKKSGKQTLKTLTGILHVATRDAPTSIYFQCKKKSTSSSRVFLIPAP